MKPKSPRTFSALLVAVLLTLLSGCGGVSSEPAGEPPKDEAAPTEEYIQGEKAIQ